MAFGTSLMADIRSLWSDLQKKQKEWLTRATKCDII